MTSKIVREDGTTVLSGVKSVAFVEKVNADTDLRPGCVASAYIKVEVYGSQSNAPGAGEALDYYQVQDGVETLIGTFYAEPSIPTKTTYAFTAYDAVSKLDVDFSAWLTAHQTDFPMTIFSLVSAACNVAGVTLGSSSWPLSTQTVNAFYGNVTCRNILQYAAEIACRFVRCNSSGEVVFDWYTTQSTYSIHPGNTQTGYIAYKQDGLEYANYNARVVEAVAIKPSGTDGAAYIYPTSYGTITATDDGNGNIVLTNLSASDSNGNVTLGAEATDDNGNVTISSSAAASNTLILGNNLLLTDATSATFTATAQNIYNVLSALGAYRPATVRLFPFENPFRAGEVISVTDAQGVSFNTLSMGMTVSADVAVIESTGNEVYADESNTQKTLAQLASDIVQINKLKVDWAEIDTAVINLLQAEDITAKNLTVIDDDGNVLAQYGATIVIGDEDKTHLELDYHSLQLVDKGGNTYFHVSDLRDATGYAEITESFTGDGTTTEFRFMATCNQLVSVAIDQSDVPSTAYTNTTNAITFTTAPSDGADIIVVYRSNSPNLKAYTLGNRYATSTTGPYSYAEGYDVTASAICSHAEGFLTTASGTYGAHAEGNRTTSSGGGGSHAEGFYTTASSTGAHAEGDRTNASGPGGSHAEGYGTTASGSSSHAEGLGTIAAGVGQHVGGMYNVANSSSLEIIGNGTSDSARSNARTIDRSGNEWLAGNLTADGDVTIGGNLTLGASPTWEKIEHPSEPTIAFSKFAGIVTVTNYQNINTAISADTWTTLITLPSGYRPSRRIDVSATVGYYADNPATIRITTSGEVDIWTHTALTASDSYISFTVSYPV